MPAASVFVRILAGPLILFAVPAVAQDSPAESPPAEPAPPEAEALPPAEPSWLSGWKGSVEIGLNGSEGNTTRLNFRAGTAANRVTESYDTRIALRYSYAREEARNTENRFIGEARNDWLFKDSPWRLFAKTSLEYDDFQDWDFRWTAHGGVGYEFLKTDRSTLLGRAGLGFSRKFGGQDEDWVFEAVLGADASHQITERQKVTASVDLYPSLSDVGQYRFVARAAWEVLVDPDSSMTLKLGIEDRYDSSPGAGFKRNDLDYFALLVWSY